MIYHPERTQQSMNSIIISLNCRFSLALFSAFPSPELFGHISENWKWPGSEARFFLLCN